MCEKLKIPHKEVLIGLLKGIWIILYLFIATDVYNSIASQIPETAEPLIIILTVGFVVMVHGLK